MRIFTFLKKYIAGFILIMMAGYSYAGRVMPTNTDTGRFDATLYLHNSEQLQKRLGALIDIKKNANDATVFKIVHIGDSHVQMGYMSDAIKDGLQRAFGDAGGGYLFPYSLVGSYGPRGLVSQKTGTWHYRHWFKNPNTATTGLTGYSLQLLSQSGAVACTLEKGLPENTIGLSVWHAGSSAEGMQVYGWYDSGNTLVRIPLQIREIKTLYRSMNTAVHQTRCIVNPDMALRRFSFEWRSDSGTAVKPEFLGFRPEQAVQRGVECHSYGLVGAQFSHFLAHSDVSLAQLSALQPDLVIFSFGSNEAYNPGWDSSVNASKMKAFFRALQVQLPNAAVMLTTCPDTRSNGRTPPMQVKVNNLLRSVAQNEQLSLFDLNAAMGGWGSVYRWSRAGLVLKDLLHFNANGYRLQGKMLIAALLNEYNRIEDQAVQTTDLQQFLDSMQVVIHPVNVVSSEPDAVAPTALMHRVKKGETLYSISRRYGVPVERLKQINRLSRPYIIRPGDVIKIR
jgi:hypothetical protein